MHIEIAPVEGLPLIQAGDDLPALICDLVSLEDNDILCVASSVFSKAKGYTRTLASITPGERAERIGTLCGEDPRFIQAVLDESMDILLEAPFVLSALACGHVGVRAGVDQSNVEDGLLILLPPDPMAAAHESARGNPCPPSSLGVENSRMSAAPHRLILWTAIQSTSQAGVVTA